MQQNGLATVREAPPPPAKEDAPAKGPGRGNLTEVEGRATGGGLFSPPACRAVVQLVTHGCLPP